MLADRGIQVFEVSHFGIAPKLLSSVSIPPHDEGNSLREADLYQVPASHFARRNRYGSDRQGSNHSLLVIIARCSICHSSFYLSTDMRRKPRARPNATNLGRWAPSTKERTRPSNWPSDASFNAPGTTSESPPSQAIQASGKP